MMDHVKAKMSNTGTLDHLNSALLDNPCALFHGLEKKAITVCFIFFSKFFQNFS